MSDDGATVGDLATSAERWCPDLARCRWGSAADLQKAALYLRDHRGLRSTQVADILGVTKQHAYGLAVRAQDRLDAYRRKQLARTVWELPRRPDDPRPTNHPDLGESGPWTPEDQWRGTAT